MEKEEQVDIKRDKYAQGKPHVQKSPEKALGFFTVCCSRDSQKAWLGFEGVPNR